MGEILTFGRQIQKNAKSLFRIGVTLWKKVEY